jgi:hypothetical protein
MRLCISSSLWVLLTLTLVSCNITVNTSDEERDRVSPDKSSDSQQAGKDSNPVAQQYTPDKSSDSQQVEKASNPVAQQYTSDSVTQDTALPPDSNVDASTPPTSSYGTPYSQDGKWWVEGPDGVQMWSGTEWLSPEESVNQIVAEGISQRTALRMLSDAQERARESDQEYEEQRLEEQRLEEQRLDEQRLEEQRQEDFYQQDQLEQQQLQDSYEQDQLEQQQLQDSYEQDSYKADDF